jgi:hypothetical protein
MIAKVALSSDAIAELSALQPAALSRAQHEALMQALEAHGLLVVSNDDERDRLVQTLKKGPLTPGDRQRWVTLITELQKLGRIKRIAPPRERCLSEVTLLAEIADWRDRSDVAVVTTEQANRLGVPAGGLLDDESSSVEVATAPIAAYCSRFESLRALVAEGHLPHRTPREEFWEKVFRPLVQVSRNVTILDHYLFADLVRRESQPRSTPEELAWLLQKLDQYGATGLSVRLLGGVEGKGLPDDLAHAERLVKDRFTARQDGAIADISIYAGRWSGRDFDRLPHDRHIRFDIGPAVKLHAGFGRLRDRTISDEDGLTWQYLWRGPALEDVRRAESRVIQSRQVRSAVVFARRRASPR